MAVAECCASREMLTDPWIPTRRDRAPQPATCALSFLVRTAALGIRADRCRYALVPAVRVVAEHLGAARRAGWRRVGRLLARAGGRLSSRCGSGNTDPGLASRLAVLTSR